MNSLSITNMNEYLNIRFKELLGNVTEHELVMKELDKVLFKANKKSINSFDRSNDTTMDNSMELQSR